MSKLHPNPNKDANFELKREDGTITNDKSEVAKTFNKFFVEKVADLKNNIDQKYVGNPLEKLEVEMASKKVSFTLKTVSVDEVKTHPSSMKKKTSSGADDIPQYLMALGADALAGPLTKIINASICQGKVPSFWKEAVVTPVLKKGSSLDVNNYRPVSCLIGAAKILESVVSKRVTNFMESNALFPENQHGFRALRSTMSALSIIQKEWIKGMKNK